MTKLKDIIPPIIGLDNDYTAIEQEVKDVFDTQPSKDYELPVSIVISVYNRVDKLSKTIAALTHQTYPLELIEVVIADDGSSDDPESLISIYSKYFPVKYIGQEDAGFRVSMIRNKGVAEATHDQIIFLDCDMLPQPTLVEAFMRYLHVTDKAVMIGGRRYVNTDELSPQKVLENIDCVLNLPSVCTETGKPPESGKKPTEDWRYQIYRNTSMLKTEKYPFRAFCSGNICLPRSVLDQVGGFDETFAAWGGEDIELGFRIYNQGYWFIPVDGAKALHQEPPNGSNETDREVGKSITQDMLIERCPAFYRKYERGRQYERPRVSIYIPAYNAELFIQDSIDSVLNQTYTDFEIVVVNDGSTDSTLLILEENYGNNSRVRIFDQENGGISSASQRALDECRGEYVLQLDSDDAILPQTLEILLFIANNSNIGFVYGDAYLIDEQGNSIGFSYSWSMFNRVKMLDGMIVHHPRLIRMRDFNRISGFDLELSNAVDYDLYLKLCEVTDGYHVQTALYLYRQHGTNTSHVNVETQDKNSHRAIISSLERIGSIHLLEITHDPENPRKLAKTILDNPPGYQIDLSTAYDRMGIHNPIRPKRYIWEINELIDNDMLARQTELTQFPSKRWIRVGPFGDIKVAISVSKVLEKQGDTDSIVVSDRIRTGYRYFVFTEAPSNDRKALQWKYEIMKEKNWSAEVVGSPRLNKIMARNQDTSSEMSDWSASVQPDNGVVENESSEIYEISNHWNQIGNRLTFNWQDGLIFFDMPEDFELDETHPDLLQLAHYVMVGPWDKSVMKTWNPTRKPGWRPGLAFSGGVDSTAAMSLMPESTVLIYNERTDIKGILNHTNAHRFFNELEKVTGRRVIRVPSNHEKIRMRDEGKMAGFSTDYACAVQVILLADHFQLDSVGTGMPLENSYFFHGYKYRNFAQSWFWKHYSSLFQSIGLPLYQPVAGCSEVVNMKIVNMCGWQGWAQSCLRSSSGGKACGGCWKCFRKNTMLGVPFTLSNEIKTFLEKKPLKQAVSTLYSIQRGGVSVDGKVITEIFPHIAEFTDIDLEWLERHYAPALKLLPQQYIAYTNERLRRFAQSMSNQEVSELVSIDFYPELESD